MDKLRRIVEWTKLKIRIESKENSSFYFREREIWWANLGVNVGYEQDGKNKRFERPVLVLKKFGRDVFWGIPMSSKQKEGVFYYIVEHNGSRYTILLTQLRLMSAKRLVRKLRTLSQKEFNNCKQRVKALV